MPEKLPPAAIQVLPEGLLGFLQLKNGGKFPQTFGSEALLPVLDLLEWYVQTNDEELNSVALSLPGIGFNTFQDLTPPAGEWWYVYDFSVGSTMAAGEAVTMCAGLQFGPLGSGFSVGQYSEALAANENVRVFMDRPHIVGPGSKFGAIVKRITAQPDLFGSVHFARLRV